MTAAISDKNKLFLGERLPQMGLSLRGTNDNLAVQTHLKCSYGQMIGIRHKIASVIAIYAEENG